MTRLLRIPALLLLLPALLAASPLALAQERQERPGRGERGAQNRPAEDVPPGGVLRLLPADAVSEKEITIGGRKLAYTATAGTLALFDQSGERSAAVFYTA